MKYLKRIQAFRLTNNWKIISDVILKTNQDEFLNWLEEINPEAYEELMNRNKETEDASQASGKRSSQSAITEKESEAEKMKHRNQNIKKELSKFENILK